MRVTSVRATPVNVLLDRPYLWSQGAFPGFSKTIVEVETDEGIVGLGEAPSHTAARVIAEQIAPVVIGADPIDIADLERRCLPPARGLPSTVDLGLVAAFGGLEIALWDIRGRAWGRPVHDLLGGAVRHAIPFVDYFAYREGSPHSPEAVAEYCLAIRERFGTTCFEGKVSDVDLGEAVRLVATLRERLGPDAMIRIDSNRAYSVASARLLARAFEELSVRNWEDPVGTFEEMRALRQSTSIPFSTHHLDLAKAGAYGVPDAIVTDVACHGGIGRLVRFIAGCEAHAVDWWPYSGDTGIGTAAYLHVCAAVDWVREPANSVLRMQPFDVIEEGPFSPRDNLLEVPRGPGLGVTLSSERLARAHRHFLEHGPLRKHAQPHRRLPLV